jgi:hypothetical protein
MPPSEIDVDQRFIGEDYAVPSPESTAAIRELARNEGIFVGPVYTGKGFAGLLDHARTRRFPAAATSSSSTPATPATCSSPPRRRCPHTLTTRSRVDGQRPHEPPPCGPARRCFRKTTWELAAD